MAVDPSQMPPGAPPGEPPPDGGQGVDQNLLAMGAQMDPRMANMMNAAKMAQMPPGDPGQGGPDPSQQQPPGNSPEDIVSQALSADISRGQDKTLTKAYNDFVNTLTPEQHSVLQDQFRQAKTEGETRTYGEWLQMTGVPRYLHAYPFREWPAAQAHYSEGQIKVLDKVMRYLTQEVGQAASERKQSIPPDAPQQGPVQPQAQATAPAGGGGAGY